jgi:hypothetical protein
LLSCSPPSQQHFVTRNEFVVQWLIVDLPH